MQTTENYGLRKPESTDFYNVEDMNYNADVMDAKLKEIEDAANPEALGQHTNDKENPHEVTKEQVGLGNVPNVTTNDQTPTYSVPSAEAELSSGEKVSVAFGKIAKAVKSLISHLADTTSHITSTERTSWNSKAGTSTATTSANGLMSSTDKSKLDGIATGAQKNTITGVKGNAESSYRTGNVNLTPANIGAAAASHGNHVPTTQTADRATFLRNDNAWQKITPSDIGAAASSHNQSASTVTAGTLGGKVVANATAVATLGDKQVRNIYAGTAELADGASLPSGDIYIQYE